MVTQLRSPNILQAWYPFHGTVSDKMTRTGRNFMMKGNPLDTKESFRGVTTKKCDQ